MQKDPSQRLFRVKCTRTDIVATLDITFPAFYPNNAPPFFIIDCSGTNLDTARQQTLLQVGVVCRLVSTMHLVQMCSSFYPQWDKGHTEGKELAVEGVLLYWS